jgi:hypothetical protein
MFYFGLFSTHLPYLIIAALYAIYMGLWVFFSLFSQHIPSHQSVSQNLIIKNEFHSFPVDRQTGYLSSFSSKNYYIKLYKKEHSSSQSFTKNTNYRFFIEKLIFFKVNNEIHLNNLFSLFVFSRPPPF